MPAITADRDLLFGLLALQNGLINQGQLVAAFQAWTLDKACALADNLVARGDLDSDQRAGVEAMVGLHLKKHGGSAEKSLAALPAGPSTRESLAALGDADIEHTLTQLAPDADGDADRTASYAVGIAGDSQRFRVLRPHAKGGLGAVFVALDQEVHREVALKQILDRHADDPASRRRFLLEAEVTGGLEHPGIVPVYGLGCYADGRPYYAMRFIRGDSLKEAIERFHADEVVKKEPGHRSLQLRKLLRRFTDVCNAIDYAHSRGVLHRDIKPGNIIVGKHGETLVVDWGLAKATGKSELCAEEHTLMPTSASGSAETLPGSALGTPAYMSPEQACGDLESLGPRSDVYSLGATLYCLLTGKPPQDGDDIGELLRKVQRGEFSPPRQLDRTIDAALEAVCMKAMALKSQDRYGTPRTLADDVERWMADEPVSAWAEPWGRRARRWARLHRTGVTATVCALAVAFSGLAGVLVVQTRANVRLADKNAELIQANLLVAKANADLAAASQKAEASAATARRVVNDYLDRITESPQLRRPGLIVLRRDLLTRALSYYEGFLRESATDPDLRAETAAAQNRAAMLLIELGDTDRAIGAASQAVVLSDQLVRDHPDRAEYRHLLAKSLNSLANPLRTTRRPGEALAAYRRGIEILEGLLKAAPGDIDVATDLASQMSNLAVVLGNRGNTEGVDSLLARARTQLEDLVRRTPGTVRPRHLVASVLHSLGNQAADRGQFDDARSLYLRALEIREAVTREHPDDWEQQSQLARINNELGLLHFHFHHPDEALSYYQKSREIREKLLAAEPASAEIQEYLARSLENLGNLYNSLGRPAEAVPVLERCRDFRARFVGANPGNFAVLCALGGSLHNLAMSYEQLGRVDEAERLYREALGHQRRAREAQPEHITYRTFLTNHLMSLGEMLRRSGKPDEAAKLAGEAAGLWPRQPQQLLRAAELAAACVGSVGAGEAPEAKARPDRFGRLAVEILKQVIETGYRDVRFFRSSKQLDPVRNRPDFRLLLMDLAMPTEPFAAAR